MQGKRLPHTLTFQDIKKLFFVAQFFAPIINPHPNPQTRTKLIKLEFYLFENYLIVCKFSIKSRFEKQCSILVKK
jgi:hypothetical protein